MQNEWLQGLRRLVGGPAPGPDEREPTLSERRLQYRVNTSVPTGLKVQGETIQAVITDLSHEGARLLAPKLVPPGTDVTLVDEKGRFGRSRLGGEIAWSQPAGAGVAIMGLQFASPVTHTFMREVLDRLGYSYPSAFATRRTRRVNATVPYELQDKNCFPLAWGSTLDLSLGGAMLKLPFALKVHEVVRLVLVTAEDKPAMTLLCSIVSQRRDQRTTQVLHHLRFFTLLPDQKKELHDLLLRHMKLHEEAYWLPEPAPYRLSPGPAELATE